MKPPEPQLRVADGTRRDDASVVGTGDGAALPAPSPLFAAGVRCGTDPLLTPASSSVVSTATTGAVPLLLGRGFSRDRGRGCPWFRGNATGDPSVVHPRSPLRHGLPPGRVAGDQSKRPDGAWVVLAMTDDRPVVRILWRSTDGGRTWAPCDVLARSPLSGGVGHSPDGWWDDGWGNLYRNSPPGATA